MTTAFQTINPANNEVIMEYEFHTPEEINVALVAGHSGYLNWSSICLAERIKFLKQFRNGIEEHLEDLANQATLEMGKPLAESEGELKKCLAMMDYYFNHAEEFLAPQKIDSPFNESTVHYRPQGMILGIMPWNFPYWQVLRFAIPTMLLGNTVLIKHAPNVQGCQNILQNIFNDSVESDAAKNAFQTIVAQNQDVPTIISNKLVRGVSFTGSEQTGKLIAELAGKNLKKAVLELGGSDAYLVFDDADVKLAAEHCFKARFLNTGQSCVAAKRWIVHEKVAEDFIEKIKNLLNDHQVAPMARMDLKEKLHNQVLESLNRGATVLLGEFLNIPNSDCFFSPIVLTDVKPGMPAFDDELFGPVASIIRCKSREGMVSLANNSNFGLGGAVFSSDNGFAKDLAINSLDTGGVFINQMYQSHASLPFGGVKNSGIGRELSHLTMYEFANIKTVVE
jgi:succinate-semialdehyde dehydrogenase/glutarate-semialdehyde dehydrogenase